MSVTAEEGIGEGSGGGRDGDGWWAWTLRPKRSALSLMGTLSTSVPSFVTQMCAGRRGSAAKPGRRKVLMVSARWRTGDIIGGRRREYLLNIV